MGTIAGHAIGRDPFVRTLTSQQALGSHPPWPMTHLGRSALATLTKMEANDQRVVLRIWRKQTVVQYGVSNVPLLLV